MKNNIFLFFLLVVGLSHVHAQNNIHTFAGTGNYGFEGDGGPAKSATFNSPFAVAEDKKGNVYVADMLNGVVRKINTAGIISTFAGKGGQDAYSGDGGAATAAQLYYPGGLVADDTGNIYISDAGSHLILKVDTFGIINRFAGIPPLSIELGGAGGYSGDGGPALLAKLNQPERMAFDKDGNLYVGDWANNRVRKIGKDGIITTIVGTGKAGYSGDGGYAVDAEISGPYGIVFNAEGDMFITEGANNIVRRIRKSGIISTYAGTGEAGYSGDGGEARFATFNQPFDLAIDVAGTLYIPEYGNNVIRSISSDEIVGTYAGTGTAGYEGDGGPPAAALLNQPSAIALRKTNMYIIELGNNIVRYIGPEILPLKLLSFSGNVQGATSILQWQTTNESNVSRFELEASIDGNSFTRLTTVKANNVAFQNNYSYTDLSFAPNAGNVFYYRLKIIDKDGKTSYSGILRLTLNQVRLSLNIYPNPVKDVLNIQAEIIQKGNYQITVFDISGREVLRNNSNLNVGSNLVSLPSSQLKAGIYTLIIQDRQAKRQHARFIKE